jgi:RHS repeat-associated protein
LPEDAISDGSGTVTYHYNAVNLLTSLVEPYGNTTTFGYDTRNNRTTTTYPNGVVQTAAYDNSSRITFIEGKKGTTVLTRFAYSYLRPGSSTDRALRYSVTDHTGATTSYTYDALDRLTRALTKTGAGATTADLSYGYDAASNRTSETVNATTTSATFNAANQLTGRGGATYSYDEAGNQTGNSAGQQLSYNAANQTTSMKQPGGTALTATYAGATQVDRATGGADTYTNSTLGVIAQNGNGLINEYTRDNTGGLVALRNSGNRYYYLFDGLGSVAAVTDPSGTAVNRYTYDPYGKTTETKLTGAVTNPWRYTGEHQDTQTGLYKIGHRYYQPELGRWTQGDPLQIVLNGLRPAESSPYSYAGCDPINKTDPSGLISEDAVFCVLGVLGLGIGTVLLVASLVALPLAATAYATALAFSKS